MKAFDPREIKEKANILEIAEALGIEVKNNKCKCFFPENHSDEDSTPSMTFNPTKNLFKCWVCENVGGSVIDLVMLYNSWTYSKAVEWLGEKLELNSTGSNKELPYRKKTPKPLLLSKKMEQNKPDYIADILTLFMSLCPFENNAETYFSQRGISWQLAKNANIGYCDDYFKVHDIIIRKFGGVKTKEAGITSFFIYGKMKLPFILIPYTRDDTVYYIKARLLKSKKEVEELEKASGEIIGRFKNTGGGVPFPYMIENISLDKPLYITEGELKALALYEHGYQAIGIPGVNSFRPSWMHMIKNQDITLIMDPDEPGLKAARELKNQFLLCKGLLINDLTKKFSKDIDEEFLDNPSLKLEDIW